MPVARRLALAGLLAATLAPAVALAQRGRCRVFADGRWRECRVEERRRDDADDRVFRHRRDAGPGRQLSLQVGTLRYDLGGSSEYVPMAALRGDWRLGRLVRSELGVSYALGDVPPLTAGVVATQRANLLGASLGVTAELPVPYLRPYVGAAAGLFARFDDGEGGVDGERFVRPAFAIPVGVRAYVSPRLAIRLESRFRFDQHPSGASATNREYTAGLSVGY